MSTAATQQTLSDGMIDAVLRLAELGWRLLPCHLRGKVSLIRDWPRQATNDIKIILAWAREFRGCNWAVATGPDSGVFVLDIDGVQGRDSLAKLEAEHGPLPPTRTSLTGREGGGQHRWFACLTFQVRSSSSKIGDHLDIRGAGGYAIVPPSIHPSGNPYQWVEPEMPIAEAPLWLRDMVTTSVTPRHTPAPIGILPEGRRNDGLTQYAGALRRKGATEEELLTLLLKKNARQCQPPLDENEVHKIATSVARYEPGGPDPLETAWRATRSEPYSSFYQQFLGLCRHLQCGRPGLPIALPLARIGALTGRHWTQARRWRQRAVREGWLKPAQPYIPHKRAAMYYFIECPPDAGPGDEKLANVPLADVPLTTAPTNGLVGHRTSSGTPERKGIRRDPIALTFQCPECGSTVVVQRNGTGKYECRLRAMQNDAGGATRRMNNPDRQKPKRAKKNAPAGRGAAPRGIKNWAAPAAVVGRLEPD
jgi:ribosomal protein L37AE/L43A